jgi:[pyruvate, water dikinase]-phosphate phosphotransferase / [pyruvate, water dikinase] kinase
MARSKPPKVFILSDGQGDTARHVIEAAAVQFEGLDYDLIVQRGIRTPAQVEKVVLRAAKAKAAIFYTLVAEDTRRAMRGASAEHAVPIVDVLGPAFRAMHDAFHRKRRSTPGLPYTDNHRIERMEAIDFTLKHDDGQRPQNLARADVVLVGVSRASKSSTCFYLAYAGIRAANVPLTLEVPPPSRLLRLAKSKVVGLRINVHRLTAIRAARARDLGLQESDSYLRKRSVAREIIHTNRLMDEHGWRSIDTSYMAIEEIAKEVIRLRGLKGPRPW